MPFYKQIFDLAAGLLSLFHVRFLFLRTSKACIEIERAYKKKRRERRNPTVTLTAWEIEVLVIYNRLAVLSDNESPQRNKKTRKNIKKKTRALLCFHVSFFFYFLPMLKVPAHPKITEMIDIQINYLF